MCSAHIFKVAYMYLCTLICSALNFFADACDFPNCPLLWTPAFDSNARRTHDRCITRFA